MSVKSKLLLLAAILLVSPACDDKGSQDASANAPTVYAIKVEPKEVPLSFEYAARAKGFKETEVRARVGGILLKRNYIEGSIVKEGDLLFLIDPEPYKASLRQAKASLAENEARLKAATTQWHRIEKLFEERIVSEKSRDDARADMDSLKATTELARAEVTSAQLNLDYTTVTAPISGVTSLESQSEGSLIVTNSDASLLTTVTQTDPIYIMFAVPDSEVFRIKSMVEEKLLDKPNQQTVTAQIKFPDNTIYNELGTINFINPTIDEATGTVMLRALFNNPKGKVMPRQFVRLVLNGLTMSNAITVPKEAVMQGAQGSFVYKINEKGLVEVVIVETGYSTPKGDWIIEKGLKTGDVVVIDGIMKIREGSPAKPDFSDPNKPKATSAAPAVNEKEAAITPAQKDTK